MEPKYFITCTNWLIVYYSTFLKKSFLLTHFYDHRRRPVAAEPPPLLYRPTEPKLQRLQKPTPHWGLPTTLSTIWNNSSGLYTNKKPYYPSIIVDCGVITAVLQQGTVQFSLTLRRYIKPPVCRAALRFLSIFLLLRRKLSKTSYPWRGGGMEKSWNIFMSTGLCLYYIYVGP